MCVSVRSAGISPSAPLWDHDAVTIIVSDRLTTGQALIQIRAILLWLGAPQCPTGATCWCGDPVALPGLSIASGAPATPVPRQRAAAHTGRISRGA